MTNESTQLTDEVLVELENVVLRQAGYLVQLESADGINYLLAEDKDNVITASAVLTTESIQLVESVLTRVLIEQMSDHSLEAKKWDGYVVILSSSRPNDEETRSLFNMTYNLNQVRRVIKMGVDPTAASVSRGLRAILPLDVGRDEVILSSPLVALRARLLADGMSPDQLNGVNFDVDDDSNDDDREPTDDESELDEPFAYDGDGTDDNS